MNQQITTQQINLSPKLSNDEKNFIVCGSGKKIKELEKAEINTFLVELIAKTVFDAGQKLENDKLIAMVNSIYPDLKNYFCTLTKKDIEHAFHLGVRKEYGEYMGINTVTIFAWLKNYVQDSKRAEAKKKQAEYLYSLNKPKQLTEEEKENYMQNAYNKALEQFKTTGKYNDIGNSIYNYLDKKGMIPFTKERKETIMKIAKENVKNRLLNDLHSLNTTDEKNKIKSALKNIETLNTDEVKVEAKKIAIQQYFNDLIRFACKRSGGIKAQN